MSKMLKMDAVKDKRQSRWQVRTFMGMVGAMIQANKWAERGVGARRNIMMPGFPLPLQMVGAPGSRSSDRQARQKASRQARARRLRTRGWA